MRCLALAAGALAAVALVPPPGARAADVTGAELSRLAGQAAEDERALARLREVDSVDGVAVDLRRALAGAGDEGLEDRLDALTAPPSPTPARLAGGAREEAQAILAERRFHATELPRPLAGVLGWIGDRIRPLVDPIGRLLDRVPGGPGVLWTIAGALVLLAATGAALWLARRRTAPVRTASGARVAGRAGPAELERLADEAEVRGDHEAALRLRFRAGLLRLDALRLVPFRESLTSGEVARRLRSAEFDGLARAFDEVVYGRRPPRREDADDAREGWRRVLAEAGAP